jgi:sortase A
VSETSSTSQAAHSEELARDAGVRLVDEHDDRVVVLRPDPSQRADAAPGRRAKARRSRSSLAARVLAFGLIAVGVLVLADAAVTFVWQEPISALYAKLRQDHLSSVLRSEERAPPAPAVARTLAGASDERARIALLATALQRHARDGSAVGRIRVPRIGANFVIVNGTDTGALQSGPGIFPQTHFPGRAGTTAIAGHRTTFLAPFRHIDVLARGSVIYVEMPYAHFTYTVIGQRVVAPTDVRAAVANVGYSRLVLSACTPLFSAAKRLLVFARLTRMDPAGAALKLPAGEFPQPVEAARGHSNRA